MSTNNIMQTQSPGFIQRQLEEAYLDCLLDNVPGVVSETVASAGTLTGGVETSNSVAVEADIEPIIEAKPLSLLKKPFVCQLVKVAGLRLAVPLALLSRIITIPDTLEINSKKKSFCYAKFNWQQKPVFVLRLESILFPQGRVFVEKITEEYQRIVVFKDEGFSFICDEELETVTVKPENVTWRNDASRRLWLAGTVKADGICVLDVQGLLQNLMMK